MNAPFTLEKMSEAERMQEIGRLLATAIERMHAKQSNSATLAEDSVDSVSEESVYA